MAVTIQGMSDLRRLFQQLPDKINTKVIKSISRKGGRVVVKAARKNTPVGETGNLKRSIQVITPRSRKNAYVLVGASVKGGARGKGYHAHLVADGIYGKGRGKKYGNWIAEAAGKVQKETFSEMERNAVPLIEREMNKLANKRR